MAYQSFDAGVVVFFRIMTPDTSLARSVHPRGRSVTMNSDGDYLVMDAEDILLGLYPRDFVSAILPLETTGPADVSNPPSTPKH